MKWCIVFIFTLATYASVAWAGNECPIGWGEECNACKLSIDAGVTEEVKDVLSLDFGESVNVLDGPKFGKTPTRPMRMVFPNVFVETKLGEHRAHAECELDTVARKILKVNVWFRSSARTKDVLPRSAKPWPKSAVKDYIQDSLSPPVVVFFSRMGEKHLQNEY